MARGLSVSLSLCFGGAEGGCYLSSPGTEEGGSNGGKEEKAGFGIGF